MNTLSIEGGSPYPQKGFQKLLSSQYWNEQFALFRSRDVALTFGFAVSLFGECLSQGPLKGALIPLLLLFSASMVFLAFLDGVDNKYRRWMATVFAGGAVAAIPLQPAFAQVVPGTSCASGLMGDLASYTEQIITAITNDAVFASQACLIFQLLAVLIVVAIVGSFIYLIFQIRDGSEFRTAANPLFMTVFVTVGILLTTRLVL
ncbi:MAG: hypothetical protein AAGE92_09670, partial [Cyanobacteria bacterium P01_G01_bin.4]